MKKTKDLGKKDWCYNVHLPSYFLGFMDAKEGSTTRYRLTKKPSQKLHSVITKK